MRAIPEPTDSRTARTARTALEQAVRSHIPDNALLRAARAGTLTPAACLRMTDNERYGHPAEVAGCAQLAARYPEPPHGPYFLTLARLISDAREPLRAAAEALGADPGRPARPAGTAAHRISGLFGWLGLTATAPVAAAYLYCDLALYRTDCRALLPALAGNGPELPKAYLTYIGAYAELPDQLLTGALDIVEHHLPAPAPVPDEILDAPSTVTDYLNGFWKSAL